MQLGDAFRYKLLATTKSAGTAGSEVQGSIEVTVANPISDNPNADCLLLQRTANLVNQDGTSTVDLSDVWYQGNDGSLFSCGVWDQTARHNPESQKPYAIYLDTDHNDELVPVAAGTLQPGQTQSGSGTFTLDSGHTVAFTCTTQVAAPIKLTVPAGEFEAFPLQTQCRYDYQELVSEEINIRWWAPSVGIVKHDETIVETFNATTTTHTRSAALLDYSLSP